MKKIASAIVVSVLTLASVPVASAREYHRREPAPIIYVSGRASCGTPIYTEKYFVGYDRHGHTIWGYRQLPVHYHGSRGGYRDYGRHDRYDRHDHYDRRDRYDDRRRMPSPADVHRRHVDAVRSIFR